MFVSTCSNPSCMHLWTSSFVEKRSRHSCRAYFRSPNEKTNDPVLIAAMLHCAKSVHDTIGFVSSVSDRRTWIILCPSVDCRALTNEDEYREVSSLLGSFIRRVDYGKDVEQELKFCVEARGSFGSLDSVTVALIQVKRPVLRCSSHLRWSERVSETHTTDQPRKYLKRISFVSCYLESQYIGCIDTSHRQWCPFHDHIFLYTRLHGILLHHHPISGTPVTKTATVHLISSNCLSESKSFSRFDRYRSNMNVDDLSER